MMIELSPCLELLFTEAGDDIGERVRAADAAGYPAGEIWSWRDKDLDALERALRETGLVLQTLCTDPMTRIVDSSTHTAFLAGLQESFELAERLHSPYLVVTAGDELPGITRVQQRDAVVTVLRRAATLLSGHPVTLLLENLNSRVDHVGTFCDSTTDVISILREVNSPQIKLLYDAYHSLVMDEDPADVLAGNMDLVGHIQIADAPGRHQPGTGTHDWAGLLDLFARLGYRGRIGLEYQPTDGTTESLALSRKIADHQEGATTMTAQQVEPTYPLPSVKGPAQMFDGDVWFDQIVKGEAPSRLRMNSVHFAPGARTAWHSHAVGQTLYVTEGVALTQERGGQVVTLRPGQTISCPPGIEHWHGAHPDHLMTHLAIWEAPEPGSNLEESTWGEHVTDQDTGA